jgi:hypothetical protein
VLHRAGRDYFVAWWEAPPGGEERRSVVRWATVDTLRPRPSDEFPVLMEQTWEFTSLALSDTTAVLMSRDASDTTQVRIVVINRQEVAARQRRSLPTYAHLVLAHRAHDAFWVLTSRSGTRPRDVPVNLIRPVRVSCSKR